MRTHDLRGSLCLAKPLDKNMVVEADLLRGLKYPKIIVGINKPSEGLMQIDLWDVNMLFVQVFSSLTNFE